MKPKSGIAGDERNIAVLLFLYVLQGIPLGLAAAVPLILTNRHVSYREQVRLKMTAKYSPDNKTKSDVSLSGWSRYPDTWDLFIRIESVRKTRYIGTCGQAVRITKLSG